MQSALSLSLDPGTRGRPLVAFAILATLSACTTVSHVTRHEISPVDDGPQAKDGISITVRVFDSDKMKEDPRLGRDLDITYKRPGSDPWTQSQKSALLPPPAFEVKISNKTGHVLRTAGTVVKLTDAGGTVYDVMQKDAAVAWVEEAYHGNYEGYSYDATPASVEGAASAVKRMKFLTENAQILPDYTETFLLAFENPAGTDLVKLIDWLKDNKTLSLRIFDIVVETDAAGNPTKKASFEFPIAVKSIRETWETKMFQGTRKVSEEEM